VSDRREPLAKAFHILPRGVTPFERTAFAKTMIP
jgi:hypothetical protein